MGRGPKATMSFTYCMARLPSNAGGGPASEGSVRVGSVASETELGGGFCPLAWAAWLSRSQASNIHASAQNNSSIEDLLLTWEPFPSHLTLRHLPVRSICSARNATPPKGVL